MSIASRVPLVTVLAGLLLAFTAVRADAQLHGSFGPTLGVHLPLGTIGIPTFSYEQRAAAAIGLQGTAWWGENVGVGLTIATAASTLRRETTTFGETVTTYPARITTATLNVLVGVPLNALSGRAYVGAGPALISYGGEAYGEGGYEADVGLGAALTGGSSIDISERFGLQGGLSLLVYRLELTPPEPGIVLPPSTQTDVQARVGIVYRLGLDPTAWR